MVQYSRASLQITRLLICNMLSRVFPRQCISQACVFASLRRIGLSFGHKKTHSNDRQKVCKLGGDELHRPPVVALKCYT